MAAANFHRVDLPADLVIPSIPKSIPLISLRNATRSPNIAALIDQIAQSINHYQLQTFEMLHKVYGSTAFTHDLCLSLSFHSIIANTPYSNIRATWENKHYNMGLFTQANPLPACLPFISDQCACVVPSTITKHISGDMDLVVEAIRNITAPKEEYGRIVFFPPTTIEIQEYMSSMWPSKFDARVEPREGWKNSVWQCLTHGQGWNFLTFPPSDGDNKRHLLFERAYNGSCILGSGQCKALNDLKRKAGTAKTIPTLALSHIC